MYKYEINILHNLNDVDINNDNIDVVITFEDGFMYNVTFFTLKNIYSLMLRDMEKCEEGKGLYFWAKDMIIIKEITKTAIEETIEDIIKNDNLCMLGERYPIPRT